MRRRTLLIAAVAVLIAVSCGAYAVAGGDSLVSLKYLTDTVLPQVVQEGKTETDRALQESYDGAKKELDSVHQSLAGSSTVPVQGQYSDVLAPRDWKQGDSVTLPTGSGFLLEEGQATVSHTGAVVDITEGKEVPTGSGLTAGHRYLVAENTTAAVTIRSGRARLAVQGSYTSTSGSGTPEHPFYDVEDGAWYSGAVAYVYRNGLFQGTDETHFSPEMEMNRAMMVTVLFRLAGSPSVSGNVPVYTDVEAGSWYEAAVRWGGAMGITTGTEDGSTFRPAGMLTREQAVSFLYRYATRFLNESPVTGDHLSGYQDRSAVSFWAEEGLSWAVSRGIITSTSPTSLVLNPQGVATRAQMAAMLKNFSEKLM